MWWCSRSSFFFEASAATGSTSKSPLTSFCWRSSSNFETSPKTALSLFFATGESLGATFWPP